ncbi:MULTISPECIES: helix-turn-helix domain-containing protein [unclassified Mesorhizobium]|uniref:helix-turn-helix domain-containing protein n=1 Tax=unclassified Mesorhizobium TaxID=325217 RepID=UPI001CCE1F83|nr:MULTISPECIES: helix-turn-helix transcriptional regulator [unclassified Mesorhizobium]MBZ9742967.1 helix-turn-helix domain-containing protein [Mesorhizobium sp. CO1-1-4]MBZ9805341.1 helix-turn-helix domain-containing protein [Mesorhizobium sp. ES1-6]MBZ9994432.1 helix-turn-helix domain-containing protein [Mesorhizobium sp. BH1-1-4]
MPQSIFQSLGAQIKEARQRRQLTQPALAERLGRDRARISELERDLAKERIGRDRLSLLVDICDALDLTPLLVPNSKLAAARELISSKRVERETSSGQSTAFEDVFVDLSDDGDK